MMAKAIFTFSNGEQFACNLRGRGPNDVDNKCNVIAWRLEKPGRRELESWTVEYRAVMPGRDFIRVTGNRARGSVYRLYNSAHILKRLN